MRLVEPRLAVGGDAHLVALEPQRALEHVGDVAVVLDDEHAGGALVIGHRLPMLGQRDRGRCRFLPRVEWAPAPAPGRQTRPRVEWAGSANRPQVRRTPRARAQACREVAPPPRALAAPDGSTSSSATST